MSPLLRSEYRWSSLLLLFLVMGGCGESESGSEQSTGQLPDTLVTLDYKVGTEVVTGDVVMPWAIDFIDVDTALVTERPGRLRFLIDGDLHPEAVKGTPKVLYEGQGGLLDVAVDPEHGQNGWVYLSYSHALNDREGTPSMTRIVRGRIRDHTWRDQEVLFEAPRETYRKPRIQYGSRVAFDPEGSLYFSIGDRGAWPVDTTTVFAQHLDRPGGKIYRMHRDGSIPVDNPFVDRDEALPGIYTYGHRNPQGLAAHPETGTLWATEHGPRGGDELNRLLAGENYGWPTITYGINYTGEIITPERRRTGMQQPVVYWRPSIATSGLSFYRGDAFPYWQHDVLVSALKEQEVRRLTMDEGRVLHQEIILDNAGRVREAVPGPNGAVYVVLNGPSRIVRLTHLADYTARDEAQ